MFKILLVSIITFMLVIITFLIFMSFLNVDIKINSKSIEKFYNAQLTYTGGAFKKSVNGSTTDFYIQFNSSGTLTTNSNLICDILIVGGGGGGGCFGGGGGAGNVLYTTNFNLSSGTYSIVVGAGGAGSSSISSNASNGSNSSININGTNYIAIGGGGGGSRNDGSVYIGRAGNNGGSGGGGSHSDISTINNVGGSSTKNTYSGWTSLGNSGGDGKDGTSGGYGSGGGGGAGSIGANIGTNSGGNGGSGVNLISTFGSSVGHSGWFGGGGGGGSWTGTSGQVGFGNGGNGLLGGGGNAYSGNGIANTGGGGGGSDYLGTGGTGGTGVVIIRYRTNITGDILDYPIVWYKFDSSSTFLNDSMNINNNLINNGTTFDNTSFKKGTGSLKFIASSSQYASIPNIFNWNAINVDNGISFSWWAKNNSSSGSWSRLWDFGNKSSPDTCCGCRYILVAKSGNSTNLGFYISKPAEYNYGYTDQFDHTTQGINYFDGNWRHYVWTISSTGIWNIYINNSKILDNVQKNVISQMSGTIYNYLGKSLYNQDGYYDGNLDDFRIYNYILTPSQVQNLYSDQDASNVASNNDDNNIIPVDEQYEKDNTAFTYISQYDSALFNNSNVDNILKNDNIYTYSGSNRLTTFAPNRFRNSQFNIGEKITITFKNRFILKKIMFISKNGTERKNAPASWNINLGGNNQLSGKCNSTDYNEIQNKSNNTYVKFFLDNNISSNTYTITFTSVLGGNELDFESIVLYEGKKSMVESTAGKYVVETY